MSKLIWKPGNLIAPVPAAMVSCGTMEKPNIITIAWTGNVSSSPAKVSISVRPERYSYGLIKESGEFVLNLTTAALVRAISAGCAPAGRWTSSPSWASPPFPPGRWPAPWWGKAR